MNITHKFNPKLKHYLKLAGLDDKQQLLNTPHETDKTIEAHNLEKWNNECNMGKRKLYSSGEIRKQNLDTITIKILSLEVDISVDHREKFAEDLKNLIEVEPDDDLAETEITQNLKKCNMGERQFYSNGEIGKHTRRSNLRLSSEVEQTDLAEREIELKLNLKEKKQPRRLQTAQIQNGGQTHNSYLGSTRQNGGLPGNTDTRRTGEDKQ